MNSVTYQVLRHGGPDEHPEGGTIAVLCDEVHVGNIHKAEEGDSYLYFEGATNETMPAFEGGNIAALKEKIEVVLNPR